MTPIPTTNSKRYKSQYRTRCSDPAPEIPSQRVVRMRRRCYAQETNLAMMGRRRHG